jgi:uncharacterized protein YutE (UPF0331/DUF86 family)
LRVLLRRKDLLQADKSKLIPHVDYLEKELPYRSVYEEEVDFKIYHAQRSKRLEVERWVESLINATLDICKILLTVREDEIPETSREILFQIGSHIYDREEQAVAFSELAKIRNTLAHRYLDIRWVDIRRFMQMVPELYPAFINFVREEMGE